MTDRNTTLIPCQECEGEKNENLVTVDVPDDVLKEYHVEKAEDLSDEELDSLLKEGRISPELTCSECGSGDYIPSPEDDEFDD